MNLLASSSTKICSEKAMKKPAVESLGLSELGDRASQRLRKLAQSKQKKDEAVHKVDKGEVEPEDEEDAVVDVKELLRRSLRRLRRRDAATICG